MDTDETPLERAMRVLGEMDATAIVEHVQPHYHGWQVDGEWLDDWRDRMVAAIGAIGGRDGAGA